MRKSITNKIDNVTLIPNTKQWNNPELPAPVAVKIEVSPRCNYRCLRGDALVDTIYGQIPIRELAEHYDTVPVYTYKDGEVFIADAINIRKYGENEQLVRVRFDDDSYIDCTPDHQFLQFKSRGNEPGTDEFGTEARDLMPGDRVRAYRLNEMGEGYINVCAGRTFHKQRSRLVMEYLMGRKLTRTEQVHHKDQRINNDHPDNLEYAASAKEHAMCHPEVAQRMRDDNPVKNMTPEWAEKLRQARTGKVRTLEQRMNYRESKLGDKNPNYIDGRTEHKSRIPGVNHKVISVTPLTEVDDVYCLEVPETGWFFSNRVLVKNCQFCALRNREHQPTVDMDFDLFARITQEMKDFGVKEIGVFYLGESFMNVPHLCRCVKHCKDIGFEYVFLTTNGSLCSKSNVTQVLEAGLNSLKFSINAFDEDQFEEVMDVKKKNYWNALQNIKLAREAITETNADCGLFASSIKFDGLQLDSMEDILAKYVTPYVDEHYWLPLYSMSAFATEREEALGYRPIAGNQGRLDNLRMPLPCWTVIREGHVTADGGLSACCFDATREWRMADLNEVSFQDGWNSDKFKSLREAHFRTDVSGTMCENCIVYAQ